MRFGRNKRHAGAARRGAGSRETEAEARSPRLRYPRIVLAAAASRRTKPKPPPPHQIHPTLQVWRHRRRRGPPGSPGRRNLLRGGGGGGRGGARRCLAASPRRPPAAPRRRLLWRPPGSSSVIRNPVWSPWPVTGPQPAGAHADTHSREEGTTASGAATHHRPRRARGADRPTHTSGRSIPPAATSDRPPAGRARRAAPRRSEPARAPRAPPTPGTACAARGGRTARPT